MNANSRPFRPFRSALHLTGNDSVGRVSFVDNFLSPGECDQVLALCAEVQELEGRTGQEGKADQARSSRIRFLWPNAENAWLFTRLEEAVLRLNDSYRFDLKGFYEGAQVARYGPGGHYDWHVDLGMQAQAARKLSISIQLSHSDEYEGGDLEFLGPTDEKAPRGRGALVAFPSFVTHKVHPVTRGERLSLVSWISGAPFR